MFRVESSGNFERTRKFFDKLLKRDYYALFDRWGQMGVDALALATPVDTGLTRDSWSYRVIKGKDPTIEWFNTNVNNGVSVAVLIQYGHGTGTGGYVVGRDYINPAMRPVFDRIADEMWKEVMS